MCVEGINSNAKRWKNQSKKSEEKKNEDKKRGEKKGERRGEERVDDIKRHHNLHLINAHATKLVYSIGMKGA